MALGADRRVMVALSILVGAVVNLSAIAGRLLDPTEFGPFAGTALQLVGLLVAFGAGFVATNRGLRRH